MSYIRSLDGIRGIAILLVLLFHSGILLVGWAGVQLFFVLSGYLITRGLIEQKNGSLREYLTGFIWRRSLRIFPLYFFFIAAVAVVFMLTKEPASFKRDWPFLLTYTTNFGRLREIDIDPAFVHLWSLAVEEQFYLIWPLIIWSLTLHAFKRVVLALILLTPGIRLGLFHLFAEMDQEWIGRSIYSLPISQFDAFATGAAIFLWKPYEWRSALRLATGTIGLTALAGAMALAYQHLCCQNAVKWSFGYPMYLMQANGSVWGYTLLNFASAALIIAAIKGGPANLILESKPAVASGRISYGLYVYHLPMLYLLNMLPIGGWPWGLLYLAVVFGTAQLSFEYLESPFLRLKRLYSRVAERPTAPLRTVPP